MKRVYVDSAAAPFIYDYRIFPAAVQALGEDNVLLGTDFPLLGLGRYRKQMDEAGVEENLRAKIMGENFLKILNRRLIR